MAFLGTHNLHKPSIFPRLEDWYDIECKVFDDKRKIWFRNLEEDLEVVGGQI